MITVIKKGSSKESIQKSLEAIKDDKYKGFRARDFCGILPLKEDALEIQKRLRNEWQ